MQQEQPDDFVIATGESHTLEEFVDTVFRYIELDWSEYVIIDPLLFRPTDLMFGKANPSKAREKLAWQAKYRMKDVVRMMVDAELEQLYKSKK